MKSDYADAMKEQADKAAELADAYEKLSSKKARSQNLRRNLKQNRQML